MSVPGKTGILILAAGSSSRLGVPKQLLSFQHKSLLGNAIDAAKEAADGLVVVILGGNYQAVEENVRHSGVHILYNPGWEEGISSSVRTGLSGLLSLHQELAGVILAVCDQPFLTAGLFKALMMEAAASGKSIVASAYGETLGTPVLFCKNHFDDLTALKGEEGAKKLLRKYKEHVAAVPFEKGETDIDTLEDYNRLTGKHNLENRS